MRKTSLKVFKTEAQEEEWKDTFATIVTSPLAQKRQPELLQKVIFEEYFLHRQTLKQLSVKYSKSISWIVKQRDEYIVDIKVHNPRAVNLVCDATFYGKRKDKLGVCRIDQLIPANIHP